MVLGFRSLGFRVLVVVVVVGSAELKQAPGFRSQG